MTATPQSLLSAAHLQHQRRALEQVWTKIGDLAKALGEGGQARFAFERALIMNPASVSAMLNLGAILQDSGQYLQAAELYQRAIATLDEPNVAPLPIGRGETWAALGFCALMLDDLPKAYNAYQQALLHLGTVLDPLIWYGIGILYDRYGSDEHALEAYGLAAKLLLKRATAHSKNISPKLIRDIYYRMGVLFRCRRRFDTATACFEYVIEDPPAGLSVDDIRLQLALVHACQGTAEAMAVAKETLLSLIASAGASGNARQLSQAQCHLAWASATSGGTASCEGALPILAQTARDDSSNPLPWYYAGRLYSRLKQPLRAHESYQQAVYREGRNAAFWNSIGILYMESLQYRDALDAFSKAITLAPYKHEFWWNLGVLYEVCNAQLNDAADAYRRASELDPGNERIASRLLHVRSCLNMGATVTSSGDAHDIHPLEVDPLLYLPRPTLLDGRLLSVQHPVSLLPPPPAWTKSGVPNSSLPNSPFPRSLLSRVMPRLPPAVKLPSHA